jgi:general secretion pathway protein D
MDVIPKQVLIEVLIAEVTLNDITQYGVHWALRNDYAKIGGYKGVDQIGNYNGNLPGFNRDNATDILGNLLDASKLSNGLSYLFDSDRLRVFLHAQADGGNLNVLSSPNILAANNKEARIEVGAEVPIVTSEYVPMDVDSNSSTSRSIEYRNTGIILTVTPRINDKGLVAMDITQEVSEAVANVSSGIESPLISNRKAETSLVVQNNQTIVIGGLIRTFESKIRTGIPYLSKIPWIGFLFGTSGTDYDRTELIILITPHVIKTIDEAESVTREITEKMKDIKALIKKDKETWESWDTN